MLNYDRVDVSEEIDVHKTDKSHKCIICNYYYFSKVNFRFQPKLYDGYHDLMQKAISFSDVAIVSVK